MAAHRSKKAAPIRFLFENSLFLIVGAVAGLVWANYDPESYDAFKHLEIWPFEETVEQVGGGAVEDGGEVAAVPGEPVAVDAGVAAEGAVAAAAGAVGGQGTQKHDHNTLLFLINDILMALFFAIAAKEVWEALLPGGALSSRRKAATPLMATLGGMVGPAGLFLLGVWIFKAPELSRGWAIPCATDIAFSYMIARLIFGAGHPAIAFLLLLAIADDAAGLMILAAFYPQAEPAPMWLLVTVGAVVLGFVLRKFRLQSFWWYLLIPGVLSWYSMLKAGLHPALGLVPIIPTMPHAHTDLGVFAREELNRDDTLNAFEHWWKNPVELILGLFGLVNAGVVFSNVGLATWLVLVGLLVGKPLGVAVFTWIGQKMFRLEIPNGMGYREVITIGMIAGIGFTVALFVATAAFPPGTALDAAKMGALASFFAAVLAYVFARAVGIRRTQSQSSRTAPPPPQASEPMDDTGEPQNAEEEVTA